MQYVNKLSSFFSGNHRIYEIVQQGFYELRIDMADFNSERRYALYKRFYIGDEASGYRLHLEDYEGTAGINSLNKNYEYSGRKCHKKGVNVILMTLVIYNLLNAPFVIDISGTT